MTVAKKRFTAFFYGTLMAEEVLGRVIYGTKGIPADSSLIIKTARLNDHRRFSIKDTDYPAVRPQPGQTVHGKVVFNLTAEQVAQLDVFEGDEYSREKVVVVLDDREKVNAETYIWIDSEDRLAEEDWNVEIFVKEKMENWISDEMKELEQDGRGNRFWNPQEVDT